MLALLTAYPAMLWLTAEPSLPVDVRTSGFSLAYSLATALLGGCTPAICTYLIHITANRAMPGALDVLCGSAWINCPPRDSPFRECLTEKGLIRQKA